MLSQITKTLCLIAVLFAPLSAQQEIRLSLQDCIRMAQGESPLARIARANYRGADWRSRAAEAAWLPELSLRINAPQLARSIAAVDQDDGSRAFVAQSQAFSLGSLSLFQPFPWTGGSLSISSGLNRLDLFGDLDSRIWSSTPVAISFQQPLFQYNSFKWNRRLEAINRDLSMRRYLEEMEGLAISISGRFFDLYLGQINLENARLNVAINDSIFAISQGRYNVGNIAENELLQSELEQLEARNALEDAKIAYDRALRELKQALDLPEDASLQIVDPAGIPRFTINRSTALQEAKANSSTPLQHRYDLVSSESSVARANAAAGLSATLNATVGYNQTGETVSEVYRDLLDQEFVNLNLEIPLFNWGRGKAEREAARADHERITEELQISRETFEQDIEFTLRQFEQLQKRVITAAKADTIAQRRFEVSKNRFQIGKITITDLFLAQSSKDGARQGYIQTLRDYWAAFYRIRQLTLFDFVKNQPVSATDYPEK